eukprot:TRINITY_DN55407_c0_g1_i1.p2 TRINITY_DN55407_c0_g1~~TRINITY_DN55407_c0_g1_i1.p2  ORF type:complete len:137 (+),score=37.78 TRINITY_DN55407_c0_g1_i1:65-475(+)
MVECPHNERVEMLRRELQLCASQLEEQEAFHHARCEAQLERHRLGRLVRVAEFDMLQAEAAAEEAVAAAAAVPRGKAMATEDVELDDLRVAMWESSSLLCAARREQEECLHAASVRELDVETAATRQALQLAEALS